MFQVVKRDGEVDEFKIGKITAAIHKAFDAKEAVISLITACILSCLANNGEMNMNVNID